jgi:hypothetical protein
VKIHSSHLSLRFYKHFGWSKTLVERYLVSGHIDECFVGEVNFEYYRPDIGSEMDCEMMVRDGHEIVRWSDKLEGFKNDLDYLRGFN